MHGFGMVNEHACHGLLQPDRNLHPARESGLKVGDGYSKKGTEGPKVRYRSHHSLFSSAHPIGTNPPRHTDIVRQSAKNEAISNRLGFA